MPLAAKAWSSKRRWMTALAVGVLGYAALPYITLWQLREALYHGNAATLSRIVDWNSVREGLKEDIADGIIGMPEDQREASNVLPPFGSGFVTGIAAKSVDDELTPDALARALREEADAGTPPGGPGPTVEWAFFNGLTSFVVALRCPEEDADEPPLRLRLELRGLHWRVVRAWVPQDLMERAGSRT